MENIFIEKITINDIDQLQEIGRRTNRHYDETKIDKLNGRMKKAAANKCIAKMQADGSRVSTVAILLSCIIKSSSFDQAI